MLTVYMVRLLSTGLLRITGVLLQHNADVNVKDTHDLD